MARKLIPYSRFSGKRQEAGESQQRQDEYAERAAREEGIEIDWTLSLKDKGISAFRGKNWKRGDLGKFIDLVDAGVVPRGPSSASSR
jgi:DNA invertase Pin-like site-specific DNA recombinase